MGILVQDDRKFANGLTINNFVITIRGNIRMIEKIVCVDSSVVFKVHYVLLYYANQAAYENNDEYLLQENGVLNLATEQISGSIFTLIYDNIKEFYNNCSDI